MPSVDDLTAALTQAQAQGATVVRTSALFPRAAAIATQVGFVPIDTLALLRLALDDDFDHDTESRFGPARPRTAPLRAWHHRRAAAVDQDAFGSLWGNDAISLHDIREATPVHRARQVRARRALAGFAISGIGSETGYIQRLAVATAHRRRGIARDLIVDALWWMRHRGCSSAYVNTGVGNTAALALYEGLGFVRLDDQLVIAEHRRPT